MPPTLFLLLVAAVYGEVAFGLPPGQAATEWQDALSLAGFRAAQGSADVMLVPAASGWTLRVRDPSGRVREVAVPTVRTAEDRENVAWLAKSLLRTSVTVDLGLSDTGGSAPETAHAWDAVAPSPVPPPSTRAPPHVSARLDAGVRPERVSAAPTRRPEPSAVAPAPPEPPASTPPTPPVVASTPPPLPADAPAPPNVPTVAPAPP
ncbi:MAG: hypothetical protein JXB39_14480, partial [Deltaproteobacteria bacterium]|nr:hypothetical protein [Deltaproteobacteria bacterium]